MSHITLVTLFSILLVPGIFLTFIPMMPAIFFMFLVALAFGFIDGFLHLTGNEVMILCGILAISVLVDYLAGMIGAKYGGASRKGMLYGFIGLLIGLVVLPPFGGFVGLFLGVFAGEMHRRSHPKWHAFEAATGALLGAFAGVVVNAIFALAFLICFIFFSI